MATSCTDFEHPYYKQINKLDTKNVPRFFKEENCERMKQVSLGELLDFASYGGMNFVCWPMSKKIFLGLIETWMSAQELGKPRIHSEEIPDPEIKGLYTIKEKYKEYFYLFNKFHQDFDEKLPWIDYKKCPRDLSHNGERIKDGTGRIRCGHVDKEKLKPSFVREYSCFDAVLGIERLEFIEVEPSETDDMPEWEDDKTLSGEERRILERNRRHMDLFEREEPTLEVLEPCYALLSDKGIYLPLETVLDRINVTYACTDKENYCLFPFSGFALASYVKAWYQQPHAERLFFRAKNQTSDNYKIFKNFQPITSED